MYFLFFLPLDHSSFNPHRSSSPILPFIIFLFKSVRSRISLRPSEIHHATRRKIPVENISPRLSSHRNELSIVKGPTRTFFETSDPFPNRHSFSIRHFMAGRNPYENNSIRANICCSFLPSIFHPRLFG